VRPLISIIIPVKNGEDSLNDCLKSIKGSSLKNYELIIVNDHSKDESMKIAKKFDCKIINPKNVSGAGAARNRGAKAAKADVLLFMDSDVIINKNCLEKAYGEFIKEGMKAAFAIYSKETPHKNFLSRFYNSYIRFLYWNISGNKSFFTSFAMIRKDCFPYFDTLLDSATVEDSALGQELMKRNVPIKIFKSVSVMHKKKVNLRLLTNSFYSRSRDSVKLFLKLLGKGRMYNEETVKINHFLNIFLVPIYIIGLFVYKIRAVPFILAAFLVSNINYIHFCIKEKGVIFSLLSFFTYIYVSLVIEIGLLDGIVSYRRTK